MRSPQLVLPQDSSWTCSIRRIDSGLVRVYRALTFEGTGSLQKGGTKRVRTKRAWVGCFGQSLLDRNNEYLPNSAIIYNLSSEQLSTGILPAARVLSGFHPVFPPALRQTRLRLDGAKNVPAFVRPCSIKGLHRETIIYNLKSAVGFTTIYEPWLYTAKQTTLKPGRTIG